MAQLATRALRKRAVGGSTPTGGSCAGHGPDTQSSVGQLGSPEVPSTWTGRNDIWVASACSLPLGPIFGFLAAGGKEKYVFSQGANMFDICGAKARAPEDGI